MPQPMFSRGEVQVALSQAENGNVFGLFTPCDRFRRVDVVSALKRPLGKFKTVCFVSSLLFLFENPPF